MPVLEFWDIINFRVASWVIRHEEFWRLFLHDLVVDWRLVMVPFFSLYMVLRDVLFSSCKYFISEGLLLFIVL